MTNLTSRESLSFNVLRLAIEDAAHGAEEPYAKLGYDGRDKAIEYVTTKSEDIMYHIETMGIDWLTFQKWVNNALRGQVPTSLKNVG